MFKRTLEVSSNPGDVVLDPFCGCGTTIDAAEKLGRDWIGIDVTQLAISLIKNRLQDAYGRRLKFVSGSARSSAGDSHLPLPQGEGMRVRVKSHREQATVPPHPGPLPPGEGESSAAPATAEAGIHLVRIIGEPTTPIEAATLAEKDKFQFQWWALGLVGARPVEQKTRSDPTEVGLASATATMSLGAFS